MPAKKTTIAAAEKRVIKAEIRTLRKNHAKLTADWRREQKRLDRLKAQADKRVERESITIIRRLSILNGRL